LLIGGFRTVMCFCVSGSVHWLRVALENVVVSPQCRIYEAGRRGHCPLAFVGLHARIAAMVGRSDDPTCPVACSL
jgi:hypothetical protein